MDRLGRKTRIKRLGPAIFAFLISVALVAVIGFLPVRAELPSLNVFDNAVEVTDQALGEMRGRFMAGHQIAYFGLEMYSEWQTTAGDVYSSGLGFGFDMDPEDGLKPAVSVVALGNADRAVTNGRTRLFDDSGSEFQDTTGVIQINQVAGDLNGAANDLNLEVLEAGASARPDSNADLPIVVPGNYSLVDDSGLITHVQIDERTFGFSMQIPGQGRVLQQLRSGGALIQQTRLASDSNRVRNTTHLIVELSGDPGINPSTVESTLRQLRGETNPGL